MVGENRLTVAMVDFYLAQTQEDSSARTAALEKWLKEFDTIYQDFREAFLGCRAHFWHGRILQELGKLSDAKAIYEEVAAHDERNIEEAGDNTRPSPRTRAPRKAGSGNSFADNFFADVEQYYLQTLYLLSTKDYKEYLEEAKTWRTSHKTSSERCYGYQALTLELAKNYLAIGEKSTNAAAKEIAKTTALRLLGEMKKIPSPYQTDAVKLRRQLNPNAGAEEGFEDAVIGGDDAIEKKQWAEATEFYEKAIAAAGPKTDQQRLAAVKDTLVGCYHNQAMQLYRREKVDEAIEMANKALTKKLLGAKTAPGVAVFLLNVQYYQYLGAAEGTDAEKKAKAELLTKVSKTAKSILNLWAAKEEGDAARIVLMRLALAQEKVAEADKIFKEINPNSREYPTALTVMGFKHWFDYKTAKKRIEADEARIKAEEEQGKAEKEKKAALEKDKKKLASDKDRRDEDRKLALDYIQKAVKALDTPRTDDAAVPETLRESQLLLAEIYREGEDFKASKPIYLVLMEDIVKTSDKNSDKPFDETALRVFDGAGQVFLKSGDLEHAATLGTKFVELGPDRGQVNRAIMYFALGLEKERRKALAESESTDLAAQSAGAAKLKSVTDLQEKILANLSKREKFSPNDLIWIVKTSANLGSDEANATAADLIERIFDRATSDEAFAKDPMLAKAEASLHALGASLQAKRHEYDKAIEQIEALIQKHPTALDPQVSEATIFTEWASKEPSKYEDAIKKWDTLRRKLERVADKDPKKVHPKYEVVLNEADCFLKMAQKTKNKDHARTGLDLLVPYLNLDDKIRNPNDAYKELSVKFYHVGGKLAEFLGLPRPLRPASKRAPAP